MKTRMFLIVAAFLVCASLSFGQGISVIWYYLPPDFGGCGAPLSGPGCWEGQPLADGTWIEIRWDVDSDGPDDTDPLPTLCNNPPLCVDGPVGTFNIQGFTVNGGATMGYPGYFAMESGFASVGILPTPSLFYLVIRHPDNTPHYVSSVFAPIVGGNEYFICGSDWACFPGGPDCVPTEVATIRTDVGSWDPSGQQSLCIDLCPGFQTILKICRPVGGPGGFDPNKPPVTSLVPGCNPQDTDCDYDCPPAVFAHDPHAWFIDPVDGCWTNVVVGIEPGCACFTFHYFLAAEILSFTGLVGDGEVNLSWTTAQDVDVSSYQVVRNGEMIGSVASVNSTSNHTYEYTDASAENGTSYTYTIRIVNSDNSVTETPFEFTGTPSIGAAVVTEYALGQNFPNPFNPSTSIYFDVVERNHVTLTVYNAAGQEVSTLAYGEFEAGRHIVSFNAGNLPSGLYFYTAKIGNVFSATKKMLLVK